MSKKELLENKIFLYEIFYKYIQNYKDDYERDKY